MAKNKFMVNPFLFAGACAFSTVILLSVVGMVISGRYGSALVFLAIGILFAVVSSYYGTIVEVNDEYIGVTTAFFLKKEMNWDDVKEVGICGTKLFKKKDSNKIGTLYIYISKQAMTDEDRFNMLLNWPPRNIIAMKYSAERLVAVQLIWSDEIIKYNAGELEIEERLKN